MQSELARRAPEAVRPRDPFISTLHSVTHACLRTNGGGGALTSPFHRLASPGPTRRRQHRQLFCPSATQRHPDLSPLLVNTAGTDSLAPVAMASPESHPLVEVTDKSFGPIDDGESNYVFNLDTLHQPPSHSNEVSEEPGSRLGLRIANLRRKLSFSFSGQSVRRLTAGTEKAPSSTPSNNRSVVVISKPVSIIKTNRRDSASRAYARSSLISFVAASRTSRASQRKMKSFHLSLS
jgi:hypothetical protein